MQNPNQHHQPLLTTAAVSRWFGISARTLCLWAECKEIPAIKIGRQWRFRENELADWLDRGEMSTVKKLALVPLRAGQS